MRVSGEGMPKPRGGRGDLLVRITYRPEVRVTRNSLATSQQSAENCVICGPFSDEKTRLRHARHSRRTITRPEHRRDHDADLRHLDLRAGKSRASTKATITRARLIRRDSPTRRCIADLESGTRGLAFASGLAAMSTVLDLLDSGSHVVVSDDLYGGTFRLFNKVRARSANLEFTYVDLTDASRLESAIKPNTRMVWIETPSNPLLKIIDLDAIAQNRAANTTCSASPTTLSPVRGVSVRSSIGFDIVVHSATKYLNGHSDMVSGVAVVGENKELGDQMWFLQNSVGAIAGVFDSFLVMRSLKTLALAHGATFRERIRDRALASTEQSQIEKVLYPGLKTHPQHELAKKQMRGFGGMVTIILENRSRGHASLSREHASLLASRVVRRRGKPDQSSRAHDARFSSKRTTRSARHHRFTR